MKNTNPDKKIPRSQKPEQRRPYKKATERISTQKTESPEKQGTVSSKIDMKSFKIKSIEYNGKNNKYIYTFENGAIQIVCKDMFIFRLQEYSEIYKAFREMGKGRIESLKQTLHYDPNITRRLKEIETRKSMLTASFDNSNSNLTDYNNYVKGKNNDFVSYNFTVGILKDRGLKDCANRRKQLLEDIVEENKDNLDIEKGNIGEENENSKESHIKKPSLREELKVDRSDRDVFSGDPDIATHTKDKITVKINHDLESHDGH